MKEKREGGIEAPTRHAIEWQSPDFYDREKLEAEMERVFDVCHGCRRCVSLCDSFPTLFDLIDESETFEVDGVDKKDYQKVADQCYLCDMCYMTKCPYVPPHEWEIDFPHLMLRAKAVKFHEEGASLRDKLLSSTDFVGGVATIPIVDVTVNTMNKNSTFRGILEKAGVHKDAIVPKYDSKTMRKRVAPMAKTISAEPAGETTGKVAMFTTCYGNYNSPELGEDFYKVFQKNNIHIEVVGKERCCGMPKMELGDLESVQRAKEENIPQLLAMLEKGFDLIAPVPSCVLMFKQELPLLFPDDPDVAKVRDAFYDPFEYLMLRHKAGKLNIEFDTPLGDISYHVACHLRVQNIGLKTAELLRLVPDTQVAPEQRCSGHDGTYAVKVETHDKAVKIGRPVAKKVKQANADYFASDCPMAGAHIAKLAEVEKPIHPMTLLRKAYGL
ncbi:heterodisulfide reductase-related iron-sulfur binding cluster [Grimontia sp. NTOU-MAR1]|uniref:heterodisulfide reductase-related iron-sulfur binding cluster n=1 Tax=Grimontia sp. NTOU-MAR1 TaxID=3111011 RepID=UPI002DB746BC|nr:heterodisulfide reductase-related iron-sulfur binding cluster [Grimontia sp. NTOU-MAR1]WRV96909.1 heterodisulfide reductase-related iron-sulfur binding cluster [Grimontia sp. NTOU-MAR1]